MTTKDLIKLYRLYKQSEFYNSSYPDSLNNFMAYLENEELLA